MPQRTAEEGACALEGELLLSRLRSTKWMLVALGVFFTFAVKLSLVPADSEHIVKFLAALSWGHLAFNVWASNPDPAIMNQRLAYREHLVLSSTIAACIVCNQCQHVFFRALSTLVVPVATLREITSKTVFLYFLAAHLLLTLHTFRNDLWGSGGQWLAALLIQNSMLIDLACARNIAKDGYTALAHIMGTMFDAFMLSTQDGYIAGVDHKAEELFSIELPSHAGSPQLHFSALLHPCQAPISSLLREGLEKITLQDKCGSGFTTDVYTAQWTLSREGTKLLSLGWKFAGSSVPLFLRCIRVIEAFPEQASQNEDNVDEPEVSGSEAVGCTAPTQEELDMHNPPSWLTPQDQLEPSMFGSSMSLPSIPENLHEDGINHGPRLTIGAHVDAILAFLAAPSDEALARFANATQARKRLRKYGFCMKDAVIDVMYQTSNQVASVPKHAGGSTPAPLQTPEPETKV